MDDPSPPRHRVSEDGENAKTIDGIDEEFAQLHTAVQDVPDGTSNIRVATVATWKEEEGLDLRVQIGRWETELTRRRRERRSTGS